MKRIFTLVTAWFTFSVAFSQPAGWNHTNVIAVTENSGATIANYQLQITFDSQTLISNGEMNMDGSDLRFGTLCDTANLNYWIESGINTPTTVVWVKIDTLFASQTQNIFMFYGNSSALTASAVNGTFLGPHSSTDSVASGGAGGVGNSQRGFRFSPTQDILVTDFGKREPTGTTRYVTLFDNTTQAVIQQIQVSGPAAQYSYGSLPNPIWLTQSTIYVLQLFQGASDGYYFGTSSQIGQHLTYIDMRYCNGCSQNTFPTNTLTNYHYGYPDLWYYTKNNVTPAPTYTFNGAFSVNLGPDSAYCGPIVLDAGNAGSTYLWNTADTVQMINVTSSGMYAVSLVNPQNCMAADTINIVVNSIPTVSLGPDIAFCDSGSITATSNGISFVWNTADTTQTILITNSGVYDVQVSSPEGCFNYDTINVIINALPSVSFDLVLDTVCTTTAAFALTTGLPAGGTYAGTGVTAGSFDPGIGAGVYPITYTYTDSNGCTNMDTASIFVIGCAGIENTNNMDVSIYPNPSTGYFYVGCPTIDVTSYIYIYDILGKRIYTSALTSNLQLINLQVSPGTYIVEVGSSHASVKKRILVK